jgi:aryl carrier-like protein
LNDRDIVQRLLSVARDRPVHDQSALIVQGLKEKAEEFLSVLLMTTLMHVRKL